MAESRDMRGASFSNGPEIPLIIRQSMPYRVTSFDFTEGVPLYYL